VIGAGDVLLHDGLWAQAARDARAAGRTGYDFDPLFAALQARVSAADLAICHLETPLAPVGGPFSSYPIFSVPPQVASTLGRLGYDTCSTASNHSIDKGEAGVVRTLDALDAAGVRHAGTARSPAEAAEVTMLLVNGIRVAHLSYTFSFNGLRRPVGKEWLVNALEPNAVLADARRARNAGAEVVIVSLHWGTEYQHTPNGHQIAVARQLLADPAIDLLLGHHAHVVQPLERIGDKWVAYGMGNEVANQNFSLPTRDGIMPRFTFREVRPGVFRVVRAEVLPVHMWLNDRPLRVLDVAATLADPATSDAYRRACRDSLRRIRAVLGQRGAYADGLVLVGD
jgi:poly-gamma-glutamate synthesis protein (capsule biosynthesis protein)